MPAIDLILNSARTQVFHPDGMTQLGIDPAGYKGIAVKSTQHFYAGFAPIASQIAYIAADGAIPPDFATIPYETLHCPLLAAGRESPRRLKGERFRSGAFAEPEQSRPKLQALTPAGR